VKVPNVTRFPFEDRFFSEESLNANERIIFHYTSAAGALGILRSRSLRLTSIDFMNDGAELRHGSESVVPWVAHQLLRGSAPERREAFDKHLRAYRARVDLPEMYVACFTEASDLLSQWRGYASPTGYALGFSLDGLREKAAQQNLLVGPVVYNYEDAMPLLRQPVSALLAELQPDLDPTKEADFGKVSKLFSGHFRGMYETCMLIKH
jgi:hypothetical protein